MLLRSQIAAWLVPPSHLPLQLPTPSVLPIGAAIASTSLSDTSSTTRAVLAAQTRVDKSHDSFLILPTGHLDLLVLVPIFGAFFFVVSFKDPLKNLFVLYSSVSVLHRFIDEPGFMAVFPRNQHSSFFPFFIFIETVK